MQHKHTPGPWRYEHDDNGFYVIDSHDGSFRPYILATGGESSQDEANARVAHAAPIMLHAIEEAIKGIESTLTEAMSNATQESDDLVHGLDVVLKKLQSARNKALGIESE